MEAKEVEEERVNNRTKAAFRSGHKDREVTL